jgi:hypothetical protein
MPADASSTLARVRASVSVTPGQLRRGPPPPDLPPLVSGLLREYEEAGPLACVLSDLTGWLFGLEP